MPPLARLIKALAYSLMLLSFTTYSSDTPYKPKSNTWVLHSAEKKLLLLGVTHSYDANHLQFSDIESMYQAFKPTLILLEGGHWPTVETRKAAIDCCGEMGFLQFLAQQDQVKVSTWEGNSEDEAKFVLEKHPMEQLKLFYALRQLPQILRANNKQQGVDKINHLLSEDGMIAQEYKLHGKPQNGNEINQLLAQISNNTVTIDDFSSAAKFDNMLKHPSFKSLAEIKNRVNLHRDTSAINQLDKARDANEKVLLIMGKLHFRPVMNSL